jgi:hypothetical protein
MIKIIDKLKYFIVSIDYLISKTFLYKQSRFKDIFYDEFICFFKRIPLSYWTPIEGEQSTNNFKFEEPVNIRSHFSKSIKLNSIPNLINKIICKHKIMISNHLGNDFLYQMPEIYETFNMDPIFSKYDVYSNIWHMDSHDGSRMLKIFILLHDVKEDEGPLIYMTPNDTRKNWEKLRERWTYDKKFLDFSYKEEKKFVGKKGSYLILNTAISSHRASIPKISRKILSISLYPSWRKKIDRHVYNVQFKS